MKKALLVILDGWGHGQRRNADAIAQANIPFINSLYQQYPNSELVTFGEEVGLPEGQMGNSEVGHLNIGAGRVVYQELARINKACREHTLQQNPTLQNALTYCKSHQKPLHLIGLVSDGGVHSHISHLEALCQIAAEAGIPQVYIHAFTDGRDVDPKSGVGFLAQTQAFAQKNSNKTTAIALASVIGRYYAMDRDKRWERVKLAYDLLVKGEGKKVVDIEKEVLGNYENGITDEFLPALLLHEKGTIQPNDAVLCFNFRTDRPREITETLTQMAFPDFDMQPLPLHYITMTRYDAKYQNIQVIYEKDDLTNTIGEVIADAGMTQVRIAETEKYPHVTFFFSGGREAPFIGEKRIMIPSPKVATYDLQPEMSAQGITDAIVADIQAHEPNFIALNYANTDMVGHTGDFRAAMIAAETVNKCCEQLLGVALAHDYECIVIADHGNSDFMLNEDGSPNTAHTTNPVPCFYVSKNANGKRLKDGKLADIAPTLLHLLGLQPAQEMTGEVLIF